MTIPDVLKETQDIDINEVLAGARGTSTNLATIVQQMSVVYRKMQKSPSRRVWSKLNKKYQALGVQYTQLKRQENAQQQARQAQQMAQQQAVQQQAAARQQPAPQQLGTIQPGIPQRLAVPGQYY